MADLGLYASTEEPVTSFTEETCFWDQKLQTCGHNTHTHTHTHTQTHTHQLKIELYQLPTINNFQYKFILNSKRISHYSWHSGLDTTNEHKRKKTMSEHINKCKLENFLPTGLLGLKGGREQLLLAGVTTFIFSFTLSLMFV